MIEIRLDDNHLLENLKAIEFLRSHGYFSDTQIQEMYDEQVKRDLGEVTHDTSR